MRPVLHVAAAARTRADGSLASAVVLQWDGNGARRVMTRAQQKGQLIGVSYRAVVQGLMEARRLRARAVIIYVDDAQVVAHLHGTERPPVEILGLYLQVRALMNAFRSADVRLSAAPARHEPIFAAAAALPARGHAYADLPLWAAAS